MEALKGINIVPSIAACPLGSELDCNAQENCKYDKKFFLFITRSMRFKCIR